jgi:hypothetical protein
MDGLRCAPLCDDFSSIDRGEVRWLSIPVAVVNHQLIAVEANQFR